ncbi:hypothetical protein P9228_20040 [Mesorhizobium sp. WSM4898]|uniref:hypothetical protein n=3 Tax=unclassified Mesorhizobium TaxID=325217 RepID=UPI0024157191|nr:hypothetical protein [Mesorhizobium sp. WSM4898]MDG4908720.1 hypothetical protein [Mesorhizobium sp. WSM4898]
MTFPMPGFCPAAVVAAATQGSSLNEIVTADSTSFTFTTLTAGVTADAYPIIGLMARSASSFDITSVTLGAQPCIELYKQFNGTTALAFFSAPRGATGNLVVTSSATMVRGAACLTPVFNLKSATTPTAVAVNLSDPMNVTISCEAGGWIGGLAYNGSTSDSISWTNLTEKFDVRPESVAVLSGASDVFATAQTNRSITANPLNTGSGQIMVLMALR